jgi:hypothetical protein
MHYRVLPVAGLALGLLSSSARSQTPPFTFADQFPLGMAQNVVLKGSGATASLTLAPQTTLASWKRGTNLPAGVSDHATVANGSRIYVIGGQRGGTVVPDVLIATVGADGTISTFGPAKNTLPQPRGLHGAAAYNGILYVVGGDVGDLGGVTNSVLMSVIGSDGQPGAWAEATPLPEPRDWISVFAQKGYLYAIAGATIDNPPAGTSTVFAAPIQADGKLGAWKTTPAENVPQRYGAAGFGLGDRVWIAGGVNTSLNGEVTLADARTTTLNPNGTPGAWSQLPALPDPRGYIGNSVVMSGGHVYLVGGQNSQNVPTASAYSIGIGADGTLVNSAGSPGDWEVAPSLSLDRSRAAASVVGNSIIVTGGKDVSGGDKNDVFVGTLAPADPVAPARYGVFESPIVNLGQEAAVGKLEFAGTTVDGGSVKVQYRIAPKSGVFGEWSSPTDLSPIDISDVAQFLQYRVLLSASGATAPELTSLTRTEAPPPVTVIYGDINGDKLVNVQDAVAALRIAAKFNTPTATQITAGDIAPKPGKNGKPFGDGTINVQDAIRILRAIIKLDKLP